MFEIFKPCGCLSVQYLDGLLRRVQNGENPQRVCTVEHLLIRGYSCSRAELVFHFIGGCWSS